MKLNELQYTIGSRSKKKRLGRGKSSGHGKTSGRGQKGQKARSGGGVRLGFEGGQTPLYRRIPKIGFTNFTTTRYEIVNLDKLAVLKETEITPEVLKKHRLIRSEKSLIKVLARSESLDKPLNIKAHKFSKKAINLITEVKGKYEVI